MGSIIDVGRGDTRSLEYSSVRVLNLVYRRD